MTRSVVGLNYGIGVKTMYDFILYGHQILRTYIGILPFICRGDE